MGGCVTHGRLEDLPVDGLADIPMDARLVADTVNGRELAIRVNDSCTTFFVGVDRHSQEYRSGRDEIRDVRVRPQSDPLIGPAFFAVVFVTGS